MSNAGKSHNATIPDTGKARHGIKENVHKITTKRHGKISTRENISSPSIKRLARRGGCKRVSSTIYPLIRDLLREFTTGLVKDAVALTEYSRRKTVTTSDVLNALQRRGHTLYGAPEYTIRHHRDHAPSTKPKASKDESAPDADVAETVQKAAAGEDEDAMQQDEPDTPVEEEAPKPVKKSKKSKKAESVEQTPLPALAPEPSEEDAPAPLPVAGRRRGAL
jgi:histone H4